MLLHDVHVCVCVCVCVCARERDFALCVTCLCVCARMCVTDMIVLMGRGGGAQWSHRLGEIVKDRRTCWCHFTAGLNTTEATSKWTVWTPGWAGPQAGRDSRLGGPPGWAGPQAGRDPRLGGTPGWAGPQAGRDPRLGGPSLYHNPFHCYSEGVKLEKRLIPCAVPTGLIAPAENVCIANVRATNKQHPTKLLLKAHGSAR